MYPKGEIMKYKESEEMYLETILLLQKENPHLHAIDVASKLGYAKSSVSRAMGLLKKNGYIEIDELGHISFTKLGKEKAQNIYERHDIITNLLIKIGANESLAEENACRIEHVITDELFDILKSFVDKNK